MFEFAMDRYGSFFGQRIHQEALAVGRNDVRLARITLYRTAHMREEQRDCCAGRDWTVRQGIRFLRLVNDIGDAPPRPTNRQKFESMF